jgi:hypothetical protein
MKDSTLQSLLFSPRGLNHNKLPPLAPKPKSPSRYAIGNLCIRLKQGLLNSPKKRCPLRFTFDEHDIFKSRLSPIVNRSVAKLSSDLFTADWRFYPSPSVRIYNARQLAYRLYNRV